MRIPCRTSLNTKLPPPYHWKDKGKETFFFFSVSFWELKKQLCSPLRSLNLDTTVIKTSSFFISIHWLKSEKKLWPWSQWYYNFCNIIFIPWTVIFFFWSVLKLNFDYELTSHSSFLASVQSTLWSVCSSSTGITWLFSSGIFWHVITFSSAHCSFWGISVSISAGRLFRFYLTTISFSHYNCIRFFYYIVCFY